MSKHPSTTLTVRLPKALKQKLHTRAMARSVTLNALLNEIVQRDLECGEIARRHGLVWIDKTLMRALLEGVDESLLKQLAETLAPDLLKDWALLDSGSFTLEGVLSFASKFLRCGFEGHSLEAVPEANGMRAVYHHDLGRRWSVYVRHVADALAERLGLQVACEITAHTVVARFTA